MEKIVFSFNSNNKKKPVNKKQKVVLKYYPEIKGRKEYCTYINSNGEEEVFNSTGYNVIKKSTSLTVASKTIVDKIDLNYVNPKQDIEKKEEYFTYNGEIFTDKVKYDEETNTYYGFDTKLYGFDKKIQLFKED